MSESLEVSPFAVVLIPLFVIWLVAVFHIIVRRSDLSIGWKGIWSAVVILIPYVGVLVYALVRPPAQANGPGDSDPTATGQAIEQLHRLVADHESGSVTDEQFAARKAAVFGIGERPSATA